MGRLVPASLVRTLYWLTTVILLMLLVVHTFKWHRVQVDTTSVVLIALLILLPLAPHITTFEYGSLKVGIGPEDARRVVASATGVPAATTATAEAQEEALDTISLVRRDPPLGLAKLRIELERELRRQYGPVETPATYGSGTYGSGTYGGQASLGQIVRHLAEHGAIPDDLVGPLREVLALANRAIHGEYVPIDVAVDIAEVGLRILGTLRASSESGQATMS